MTQILATRQIIVNFFKKHENIILLCAKFAAGLFIFGFINSIGLYREEFALLFKAPYNFPYLVLLALLFTVLPPTLANMIIMLALLIQISVSVEVTAFVFLLLVCVIVFYARLQPARSFLLIAMIIGFYFKMPYVVVIFAGLYLGLSSIVPVILATLIFQIIPEFKWLVNTVVTPEKMDITTMPETFLNVYRTLYLYITNPDNFGWIYTGFSFAVVIVAVHAVSKLSFNYSKDIAILMGGFVNLLCGLIGIIIGVGGAPGFLSLFFFTLLAVGLVEIVRFFDNVLDYKKVERVQFEDDDNYYYVKVVPKIVIAQESSKTRQQEKQEKSEDRTEIRRPRRPIEDSRER